MNEVQFLVKGSASEPYKVTFSNIQGTVKARCSCPAGKNGMMCKHRLNIFNGSDKTIVSNNQNEVLKVTQWFQGSQLENSLKALRTKQNEAEELKKTITKIKKEIAKMAA